MKTKDRVYITVSTELSKKADEIIVLAASNVYFDVLFDVYLKPET